MYDFEETGPEGLPGSRPNPDQSVPSAVGALGRLARLDTRSSVLPAQASSSDVLSNRVASLLIGTRLAPPLLDRLLHEKTPAQQMGHGSCVRKTATDEGRRNSISTSTHMAADTATEATSAARTHDEFG